jgi:cytochrome c oxidase subunit IV
MSHSTVDEHARPTYHVVFIILAVFTGLEIAASYLPAPWKIPVLVVLAVTKAVLVLMFFMHLKYDSRLFAAAFAIGVVLAVPIVLIIVLVMPTLR